MKLKFLQFFLRAGGCYNKHLSAFNSRKKEKYRLEKLNFCDSTYTDRERDGTEICAVKVLHVLIIIFCNMLHVGTKMSSTLTYNMNTYCTCHTILSTVILSCSLLHYAVCKCSMITKLVKGFKQANLSLKFPYVRIYLSAYSSPHPLIHSVLGNQIVNGYIVSLPNSVSSVLTLHHQTWRPI